MCCIIFLIVEVVESCLEAVCKPDPRIYHLCLHRLGVLPQEAVFLDDIGSNAKAAAQLGMHAIKVLELLCCAAGFASFAMYKTGRYYTLLCWYSCAILCTVQASDRDGKRLSYTMTPQVMGPDSAIKELSAVLGFPLAGFVRGTRSVRKTMQVPVDQLTHYLQEVLHLPSTGNLPLLHRSTSFLISRHTHLLGRPFSGYLARCCLIL